MDIGIKVVLPGAKVDNTDKRKVVFTTDNEVLRVKTGQSPQHSGVIKYKFNSDLAQPASGTTLYKLATIQHKLPFVPANLSYVYIVSQDNAGTTIPAGSFYPTPVPLSPGVPNTQYIYGYADATNFYLAYAVTKDASHIDLTGFEFQFKYYIFTNQGV